MRTIRWALALADVVLAGMALAACTRAPAAAPTEGPMVDAKPQLDAASMPKTEEEWKKRLTPEQYRVARQKGTEAPWTGAYVDTKTPGTYRCSACGAVLFRSESKFDSHCGWPAFSAPAKGAGITESHDSSHGMERTEVTCTNCGAHLGHVFDDGPGPTHLRYCINSVSLKLDEDAAKQKPSK
jgi:peptide-methionine (R)-S-oxide reductase